MELLSTHHRMTAREYYEMPGGPPYFQLVDGELFMSPSPSRFHQDVLLNLGSRIREYLRAHPVGSVHLAPSDVNLDNLNVFQPDLYFVSHERQSLLTRQGASGAPDLIVEISSPGTARLDERKRRRFAAAGTREFWWVFTFDLRIEVFQLQSDPENPAAILREDKGDVLRTDLFPGLELPLAEIFRA